MPHIYIYKQPIEAFYNLTIYHNVIGDNNSKQ